MSEQEHRGPGPSEPARTQDVAAGRRPGADPDGRGAGSARRFPGPTWLPWALAGVVVLVLVVVAVLVFTGDDDPEEQMTPAAVEVVGPEPTPTGAPVPRGEGSALFLALPDTVRQYVVASIAPSDAFASGAALESVSATYTGPLDGAEASYLVLAGQWPTPEEAAAQAAALVAATGAPVSSGDVMVGDAPAGTYSIIGVDDSTSTVVWTNGTLVVQATGPAADIENFYLAFAL